VTGVQTCALPISKGRPVVATSKRQQRLAEKAARAAANGGVVKRGRPSTTKVETATEA